VTKTTAQDASGSTIVSADDPRLDRFGHANAHALTRPIAAPEEAVDAAGPWTRRRAHRALENGGPFPTAPTAILVLLIKGEKHQTDLTHGQRPASDNYPSPPRSTADSFASPSPAEIVVANRQK
jgi:hypothetical protein